MQVYEISESGGPLGVLLYADSGCADLCSVTIILLFLYKCKLMLQLRTSG